MNPETTRQIITDWTDREGRATRGVEAAPASGDVHRVVPPDVAARDAAHAWDEVDEKLKELEPQIGHKKLDELLSLVNALQCDVRSEAISRMVYAARAMFDFPISLYAVLDMKDPELLPPPLPLPRGPDTIMEAAGNDEALARAA